VTDFNNLQKMSRKVAKRKSKPTVSIVGAGRLGKALAMTLSKAGYRIEALVSRRRAHALKAAALVRHAASALGANELKLLPPSKVILITTPDDEIRSVAQRLADAHGKRVQDRVVLHTSGALSSEVLNPLAAVGFQVGSLHPLVSVSDPRTGQGALRGAFYCVEGDAAAARRARVIVRDLKGQSFAIPSSNKPLYHAAAVMASGHVVALFDLAVEMLMQSGFSSANARRVLTPLLESTIKNLSKTNPARALTGAFARGDLATIQRHLQALSKPGAARAREVYKTLGAQALDLAKKNGVKIEVLSEIRKALES